MRTTIDLDDELIAEAMKVTGLPTKKATVEEAAKPGSQISLKKAIAELAGLGWEDDLDAMREGRSGHQGK